jgi:transcriptional regulator with XRE-family HTH domain
MLRALRRRRGLRQGDCAALAGVHRSTWSRLERGQMDRMALGQVRSCLAVLEVRLELLPRWRGGELDRLRDASHAALVAAWKRRLQKWGWQTWVEVSFNHLGERGRVDLLAWHPVHRTMLVVEVKTEIDDVQALLGVLDMKARLAPAIARQLGISSIRSAVAFLIVAESTANRERIDRLGPLFSRYALRGRSAIGWLRRPAEVPTGLLAFTDLRSATGASVKQVGAHRVRRPKGALSVERPVGFAPTRGRVT